MQNMLKRILRDCALVISVIIVLGAGLIVVLICLAESDARNAKKNLARLMDSSVQGDVKSITAKNYKIRVEISDQETIDYFCRSFSRAECDGYLPRTTGSVWTIIVKFKDDTTAEYRSFFAYSKDERLTGLSFGCGLKPYGDSTYYWAPLDEQRSAAVSQAIERIERFDYKIIK
jgi:hypothetical protein